VSLNENLVGTRWVIVTFEEMIEANFVERSARCKARDVTTNSNPWTLCSVNHDGRVPSHPCSVGSLYLFISRELWLILR
jgi:hypothetical protein